MIKEILQWAFPIGIVLFSGVCMIQSNDLNITWWRALLDLIIVVVISATILSGLFFLITWLYC